MKIWVEDADGPELIGETRATLEDYLNRTASEDYSETVLNWFDSGESDLSIMNGTEEEFWMKR